MIRANSRYENLGENPTKYFWSQKKRNVINKTIVQLIDNDNNKNKTTEETLEYKKNIIMHYTQTHMLLTKGH